MSRADQNAVNSESPAAYETPVPGPHFVNVSIGQGQNADDAVIERARAILDSRFSSGRVLASPAEAGEYCSVMLADRPREVFACLFLDNRHAVIRFEIVAEGTIGFCAVHPREVVRRALELNVAAVIFAHNHPSGNATPSAADRAITEKLKQALDTVDVRVLDHFVCGRYAPTSFAERGLL